MVQPIAPIAPYVAVPPAQPVQNSAAPDPATSGGPFNTAPTNTTNTPTLANNTTFINALEQDVALQDTENLLSIDEPPDQLTGAAATSDDAILDNTVLANLSPQALNIISEAISQNTSPSGVQGVLSTSQLQEIAILETDAQLLNEVGATPANSEAYLFDSASSVNLSPQAFDIINNIEAVDISTGSALTTAQLQQVATAIAPFINEPLTPATVTQIQNALIAIGFNPNQISLQNYFLSMNYLAELLPAPLPDIEQQAINDGLATELVNA